MTNETQTNKETELSNNEEKLLKPKHFIAKKNSKNKITHTATLSSPQTKSSELNHKKRYFNKKHNKTFQPPSTNYLEKEQDIENTNTSPFSEINSIFSLIRQKTGLNLDNFIKLLTPLLKDNDNNMNNILSDNGHTLLSYSVLYGNEVIFNYLMDNYSQSITQEEVGARLLTLCLNKNPIFLERILEHAKNHFSTFEPQETILLKAAKMGHRSETNNILISWIAPFEKTIGLSFWQACLKERNVVLFEQALYSELINSLKENFNLLATDIEQLGKKHTVNYFFNAPSALEQKANEENCNVLSIDLTEKDNKTIKTEITVKRKKVVPHKV